MWFVEQTYADAPLLACQRKVPGASFADRTYTVDETLTTRRLESFELQIALLYEEP